MAFFIENRELVIDGILVIASLVRRTWRSNLVGSRKRRLNLIRDGLWEGDGFYLLILGIEECQFTSFNEAVVVTVDGEDDLTVFFYRFNGECGFKKDGVLRDGDVE